MLFSKSITTQCFLTIGSERSYFEAIRNYECEIESKRNVIIKKIKLARFWSLGISTAHLSLVIESLGGSFFILNCST